MCAIDPELPKSSKTENGIRLDDGDVYISVNKAAQRYFVIPETIRYHIDKGNLKYRYEDRRYWVSLSSLNELYQPKHQADDLKTDPKRLALK